MISKEYFDIERQITWRINQPIHYYKYSHDGIIIDGGYGLIIDIQI